MTDAVHVRSWRLLSETFREWIRDDAMRLSAAVAFYAMFSLAPLLLLALSAAAFFLGQKAASGDLTEAIAGITGPRAAEAIQTIVADASAQRRGFSAPLVGIGLLLIGASGVFRQLKGALNLIWDVPPADEPRWWTAWLRDRAISILMAAAAIVFLLASVLFTSILSALRRWLPPGASGPVVLWQFVNVAATLVVITIFFAAVYRFVPDADLAWRDVLAGAFIAASLFTIAQVLFGAYFARSNLATVYGAAGSLVVILVWVYVMAMIFFFGAEFAEVSSRREPRVREELRHRRERGDFHSRKEGSPAP